MGRLRDQVADGMAGADYRPADHTNGGVPPAAGRSVTGVWRPAAAAIPPSRCDRRPAALRHSCGRSADSPRQHPVGDLIAQAPHAPDADGPPPSRARKAARRGNRSGLTERNLPDIAVPEIPVDEAERPLPPPEPSARNALVDGPILRTLLWLAWPNVVALSAGTCVVIAETSYIGRLGVESLAAMALVFPFVILTMTMSGGAMGGGVASAIARALGAGDVDRASALAAHALLIGACFGLTFTLVMLIFGPRLLETLGGRGNVLANAIGYAQIFFGGAVLPLS